MEAGQTFIINCTTVGIPTPEIVWRQNWGCVPEKCTQSSTPQDGNHAFGELICPNAQDSDQGAYSCEAINIKGSCFAGSTGKDYSTLRHFSIKFTARQTRVP